MLDFLYECEGELKALGSDYKPPKIFRHGEWEKVVEINSGNNGGHDIEIFECRLPATFYKIVAKPTKNSIGGMMEGFILTTGSGMHALVIETARAILGGMIGYHQFKEEK